MCLLFPQVDRNQAHVLDQVTQLSEAGNLSRPRALRALSWL